MKAITIKDLYFAYDDKTIYTNYSTSFPLGEISVITSPSGTGKTTMLNLISGLLTPDSGSILFPMDNPRFSMVFQDLRLIENISVEKNIRLVNDNIDADTIDTILCELGLSDYGKKMVRNLSGGEKQRVAIARALLAEFDILLLDEPYAWLDADNKEQVKRVIEKYRNNRTTIVVEH